MTVKRDRPIAQLGALRRRRRRYSRAAWRQHTGLTLPTRIELPGHVLVERQRFLSWRIRLTLWALLGASGALFAQWPGAGVGLAGAVVVELFFSYCRPRSPTGTGISA